MQISLFFSEGSLKIFKAPRTAFIYLNMYNNFRRCLGTDSSVCKYILAFRCRTCRDKYLTLVIHFMLPQFSVTYISIEV